MDDSASDSGTPRSADGSSGAWIGGRSPTRGRRPSLRLGEGLPRRSRVLLELFKAADGDQDGLLDFAELFSAMNLMGLDARAEAVKPVFDTFDLAREGLMAADEFMDFLLTYLRIKFGGTIAHLVTNARAFADYLGVVNDSQGRQVSPHRRSLLAQAIASDAATEDGRRMSLAALAAHGFESPARRSLFLPGLVLPRRPLSNSGSVGRAAEIEAAEIEVEARHVLTVSLARLLDCPPESVLLHEDSSGDWDDESSFFGAPTVSASASNLSDDVIGRALAALVNGDLNSAKEAEDQATGYQATLKDRGSRILEVRLRATTPPSL